MTRKNLFCTLFAMLIPLIAHIQPANAEDPFAIGADALAVADSDGSASLRAKLKMKRMEPDMIAVRVMQVDDKNFPHCIITGKVLQTAKKKDKYFKLMARGKTYRFAPQLKIKSKSSGPDLKDPVTQNNLGGCYYPKKTKLVLKISGVDLKTKVFNVATLYAK